MGGINLVYSFIINFNGEDHIEEWEDMLLHEGGVIADYILSSPPYPI